MKMPSAIAFLLILAVLQSSGCSLVTVPIKAAGSIVTTTVSTTGDVVTAPFDAVSGRERDKDKDKKKKDRDKRGEEANGQQVYYPPPQPVYYPDTPGGYYYPHAQEVR